MTATISQRIKSLNVLMTLFIVALHTMSWEERMWPLRPLVNMAVPVFFVISSYLYFQNWTFSWQCYVSKLKHRLYSLYLPFVIYNVLYIPFIILKTYFFQLPNERHLPLCSVSMLMSVLFGVPYLPNTVLWYIRALLIFSLFAPLIAWLVKCGKIAFIIVLGISMFVSYRFSYISVVYWIPCLLLGCFIAFYEKKILQKVIKIREYNSIKVVFFVFFLFFLFVSAYQLRQEDVFISPLYFYYRMTIPILVLLYQLLYKNLLSSKFVYFFLPYTFPIYCLHVAFVNISVMIVSRCIDTDFFVLIQLMSFLLALVMVYLFCLLLRQIKPLWSVLTGFRSERYF